LLNRSELILVDSGESQTYAHDWDRWGVQT
jgi:hypothetical protein